MESGSGDAPGDVEGRAFREALARLAAGVSVIAVRDGADVHATTLTSLTSVSADPPRVLVSLGPAAQVLPFLEEGVTFAVSLLAAGQARLASDFADSFPVGPSPFPAEGVPGIPGSLAVLSCRVEEMIPADPARIVLARVESAELGSGGEPLVYFDRRYGALA